ncbi:hypothetical protein BH11BAC3_BH11BAC3_11220 [soil metagenome]
MIGLAIIVQAVISRDLLLVIVGLSFSGMAVFNIGCCGTAGCHTTVKKNVEPAKDITYEELV